MQAIVNTSPLVFLSKLGKLDVLNGLFEDVYTTANVLDEVLEGLTYGYQDALLVKKKIEKKEIEIIRIGKRLGLEGISKGEKSVLEGAVEYKINSVVLDDLIAIKLARYLGLTIISTPFVLLKALEQKKIEKQDFVISFNKLINDFDYRISPILYKNILDLAEEY